MSATNDLVPILKKLRLSGVLQSLDVRTRQAVDEEVAHVEFLYRLLVDEVERREAKQLGVRLSRASFEHAKTIEDFDFAFNPKIPRAKILDLATCAFVERRQNVLLVGPSGTGKSHIAQALGHRACRAGYAALYTAADAMFQQLRAARADQTYEKRLLRFTSPEVLIVDDLGLTPLRQDEPLDLHAIIRRRHQRGSLIVTSNRALEEWYPLFGDALLASAAMDRLLDGAHVLEMQGDSYRNPPKKRGRGAAATAAAPEN